MSELIRMKSDGHVPLRVICRCERGALFVTEPT